MTNDHLSPGKQPSALALRRGEAAQLLCEAHLIGADGSPWVSAAYNLLVLSTM